MMAVLIWGYVRTKNGHLIRIFFPLVIIYLLLVPCYVLVFIVYLFLLLGNEKTLVARNYMKIFFRLPDIFRSLVGTHIEIDSEENKIKLSIR